MHKRNSECHFPNNRLLLFCWFVSISNRRGRCIYCAGHKTSSCCFSVGKCYRLVSPLPREGFRREMLCPNLPAHVANSQRNTHCVSPLYSSSSYPPPACFHLKHTGLPTAEEIGTNSYSSFTVVWFGGRFLWSFFFSFFSFCYFFWLSMTAMR